MARMAFAQLYVVHQLHPYLDPGALCMVTQILIISWLGYCNALYTGLPLNSIQKLHQDFVCPWGAEWAWPGR